MLCLLPDSSTPARFTPYTALHPAAPAPELGRAFTDACHVGAPEHDTHLRAATIALVERLKADRLPPERVVIALKSAIARYSDVHTMPSLTDEAKDDAHLHRTAVYQRVLGWCLDAYFAEA